MYHLLRSGGFGQEFGGFFVLGFLGGFFVVCGFFSSPGIFLVVFFEVGCLFVFWGVFLFVCFCCCCSAFS